jgi:multiple RNA-binding domain-containing protein 1
VHIPLDPLTKQPKGLAYITFTRAQDAVSAYDALDKTTFQGRLVHILAAVDRKSTSTAEDDEGKKKTLKQERVANRKAAAGKGFNWGLLYMNVRVLLWTVLRTLVDWAPCRATQSYPQLRTG